MKRSFLIILLLSVFNVFSQKKTTEKVKDSVKTEVVEVITTYNPEIADATKITINPTVKLLEKTQKQPLNYSIFSVPVASTFIPKTGVLKSVDVGVKERIYDNFLAAGFGNYISPYLETFLHKYTRFQSEFGFSAKYIASFDNIENTVLDSDFSNLGMSVFYKQEERYFDWKVSLNAERNQYNWYGIDADSFKVENLKFINEKQQYNFLNAVGEIDFIDAYIDKSSLSVFYFNDSFSSNEILIGLDSELDIPTSFLIENLKIGTRLEYLDGSFKTNYANTNSLNHQIFTVKIAPEYKTVFGGFSLKLAAKLFGSFDVENSLHNFLVYPDIKFQKSISKEQFQIFGGISGDLKTNSYKDFVNENPFVSPTISITQTAERINVFSGFNGVLNNTINYTFSASFKNEQDKPLFVKNNSKSDGISTSLNGVGFKGYEYGNSFGVVYDDVKTTSIFAELNYEFNKKINFEANFQYDYFSTTNQVEAWNLPSFQANLMANYKNKKWYATTTFLFVGERNEAVTLFLAQKIPSFLDINLNGGYHFNDKFSTFLKVNNLLNSNYQRFANFEVQGFQILAGLVYKFDF